MRHWGQFLIAGACLLSAGAAAAQIDPNPDGIGIYADLGGMVNSIQAEAGETIEVYLLATRISQDDIAGAEFKITPPANAMVWGFVSPQPGAALLFPSDGSIMLAWAEDTEAAPVVHLLSFIIRMTDGEAGHFYIAPSAINSGGFDSPVYVSGFPTPEIFPLHPYPGEGEPSFSVNSDRVAVADETWGGVKALFRP